MAILILYLLGVFAMAWLLLDFNDHVSPSDGFPPLGVVVWSLCWPLVLVLVALLYALEFSERR